LEDETSQHDVLAEIAGRFRVGCCCDTATKTLEDETDEVAGAEDEGVCARLETGEVLAIDDDNAAETEVDLIDHQYITKNGECEEPTDAVKKAGAIVRVMR